MACDGSRTINPGLDTALETLSDRRHRCVLYCLRESEGKTVSLDRLVEYLLVHDPDSTDEDHVTTVLYHMSLPKLEDAGWIEYDARSGAVRYRSCTVPEELLLAIRERELDG